MTRTKANKIVIKQSAFLPVFIFNLIHVKSWQLNCERCLQFVSLFEAGVVREKLKLHLKVCVSVETVQGNQIESSSLFLE